MDERDLLSAALRAGADKAACLSLDEVVFNPAFRALCESNACGNYGRCHTCPPMVGEIEDLISDAKQYSAAVLYQTVAPIEDSFDIEGMLQAGRAHNACTVRLRDSLRQESGLLHLSTGGCHVCERCSARDSLPCTKPEEAIVSLEAYGVDVYTTAQNAGLRYVHGPNTVTYFGMILYGRRADA